EELERWHLARSQSQRLQVEHLHQRDEHQDRERDCYDSYQGVDHTCARSISPSRRANFFRHLRSVRAISPPSFSWSIPIRCSTPCNSRILSSSPVECPCSCACSL